MDPTAKGTAPDAAPPTNESARTAVIEQNLEAIMAMHALELHHVHRHQRAIERIAAAVAVPSFFFAVLGGVVLWVGINALLIFTGHHAWDRPPFALLQTTISILGLAMTLVVVITQQRLRRLTERNEHLNLQLTLLVDQKTTKIILLLEEMRQDSPILPNRNDPEVDELTVSVDPAHFAQRISERLTETQDLQQDDESGAVEQSAIQEIEPANAD